MTQIPDAAVQAAHAEYHKVLGDLNRSDPMRTALTAAYPLITASIEVEELSWEEPTKETNGCWTAKTVFGTYSVVKDNGWYAVLDGHAYGAEGFEWLSKDLSKDTRQTAFAAANADYRKRKLDGLIFKPVDVAAVREAGFCEGVEKSAKLISTKAFEYDIEAQNVRLSIEDRRLAKAVAVRLHGRVLEIRAISAAPAQAEQWQPIETAPKDGEAILIWKPDERMVGEYLMSAYWCDDRCGFVPVGGIHKQGYFSSVTNTDQGYPSHWMPLPAAPNKEAGE